MIANKFIDTMNAAFKTSIPDVNLVPIAAADPLFPPYPGHHAVSGSHPFAVSGAMPALPPSVIKSLSDILVGEHGAQP